jgi:hypothetical protein
MNNVPAELLEPLTREILRCWLNDPEKLGTLESIVEWWLLEQQIRQATVEVRAVLEKLVATGLVEQWQEADGRIYYRLSPGKEAEARGWVESGGDM